MVNQSGKGIKSHSVLGGPKILGSLFSTGNTTLWLHSWHQQDIARIKGQLVLGCLAWASEELQVQKNAALIGSLVALARPRQCRRRGPSRAEVQREKERQHGHCTALEPSVCVVPLSRTEPLLRGSRGQKYSAFAFQNIPLLLPLSSFFGYFPCSCLT